MVKLSDNFSLAEMIRSAAADRLGDKNLPTAVHMQNLKWTAHNMERVRSLMGELPIQITSGYRNPKVNKSVGGVSNSAHALGLAVDFVVPKSKLKPIDICRKIIGSGIKFDQIILERNGTLIHISFDPRNRMQVLTQKGGAGSATQHGLVP